jgi:hypothetical protein
MSEIIEQRLKLLETFKSSYITPKGGFEKRFIYLKITIIVHTFVIILGGGVVATALALDKSNWEHSALLVLLSLNSFLFLHSDLYEFKLSKHQKKLLQNKDIHIDETLNADLDKIITRLNYRFKGKWHIIGLAIITNISAAWQTFPDVNNPYWEITKIPILLLLGIILIEYYITNQKISENIKNVENRFQV